MINSIRFKETAAILSLTVLLAAAFFGSFLLGRYPVPPEKVAVILASKVLNITKTWPDTMETVVLRIRFPRIAAALLVGGVLSVSGSAYQSLFRNPLVSPAILGVSAGAGFGAVLGMALSLPWVSVQTTAFIFGLLAVTSSILIVRAFGNGSMIVLVLGGIVISAFFEALISVVKYMADPIDTLPSIVFWLMGGLAKVTNHDVMLVLLLGIVPFAVIYSLRWQINVLSMGEEEALALGVNAVRVRLAVIVCATLMTSAAVSISGIVGWVGLLIPHIARMITGARFHVLLPVSFLMGGLYLLLVDNLCRSFSTVEIPLGILTAIIGAPFFVFLLSRFKGGWA